MMKALAGLIILVIIFPVTDFFVDRVMPKIIQRRTERRKAELDYVRRRIREVDSGLPLLATNVRSTARAEDYGSDPWLTRTVNRSAEIKSDQALLDDLMDREQKLLRLIGEE